MTSNPMNEQVIALGRGLAERLCPNAIPSTIDGFEIRCIGGKLSIDGQGHLPDETCKGTGYDTRFQALREPVRYGHLSCTHCGSEHVDPGELAHDPHKTHLCHACGKLFPSPDGYVRSVGIRSDAEPYDTFNLDLSLDALWAATQAHGWRVTLYPGGEVLLETKEMTYLREYVNATAENLIRALHTAVAEPATSR